MTDENKPRLEVIPGGKDELSQEWQKALDELSKQTPFKTGYPVIWIKPDVEAMTTQAESALTRDMSIYKRDKQLVHVIDHNGVPSIEILHRATLLERLSAVTNFVRWDKRDHCAVAVRPDDDVVNALLVRKEWANLRELTGITVTPTLRADGTILQGERRYDEKTGLLYVPNEKYPPIPDDPSQEDAKAAYSRLLDLFSDFPHEDNSHKAVPLAHAMTIIARAAIAGAVPMIVYDANVRGSGKTLQTDVVSMIATGSPMARATYPTNEEELEKILGGYALQGAVSACFDNVNRALGGAPLDKALTSLGLISLRVLGKTGNPIMTWRCVLSASGNNITYTADTARRTLQCRLISPEANPESRVGFKYDPLLAHVAKNRGQIVADVLTVLRAYCAAKRPDVGVPQWGSFEAWSALIPAAIVYAGGSDPMSARPKADATPDEAHFATLLMCLARVHGRAAFTASGIKEWLFPSNEYRPTDDNAKEAREAVEELCQHYRGSVTNALGYKLRRYVDRVFELPNGRAIRVVKAGSHGRAARWAIEVIELSSSPSSPDAHPSQIVESSKEK